MFRRRSRADNSGGFTLLELIVAVAVFSVMSVTAYTGLRNFISIQQGLEQSEAKLAGLQTAVSLIEQDLNNAVTRSIRDELGDDVAAMKSDGTDALELTRRRPGVPIEFSLVDMKRVDYFVDDQALYRRSWEVLDRVADTKSEDRLVLEGVIEVSWQFFAANWGEFWPQANDPFSISRLPAAVRFELKLVDGRSVERIVLLNNQG